MEDGGGRAGPFDGPDPGGGRGAPADGPGGAANGVLETCNFGSPGDDGFTGSPPFGVIFSGGLDGSAMMEVSLKVYFF